MDIQEIILTVTNLGVSTSMLFYLLKFYIPKEQQKYDELLKVFVTFTDKCSSDLRSVVSDNNKALQQLKDSLDARQTAEVELLKFLNNKV